MEIQLLGAIGVRTGNGNVHSPPRTAAMRLLAVLAIEASTQVSETALLDAVWGDSRRTPAPGTLRRNIDFLRDTLANAGGSRDWVTWDPRSHSWTLAVNPRVVDYHRFLDEIDIARTDADWDRLHHALSTQQYQLLPTIENGWADTVRHHFSLRRSAAVKALFTHLLNAHRVDDLVALLGPCEDDIVKDETLLRMGSEALAAAGRHAEITTWESRIADRVRDERGAGRSADTYAHLQRLIADPPGPTTTNAASALAVTLGLPRDIPEFIGRDQELHTLLTAVQRATDSGVTTIAIHAIDGMPGVGKTALGIHAAHLLAPRFPDGQLLLKLDAHAPGQKPRTPFDALHSLLTAIGVHADILSRHKTVGERELLWRTLTANRRMLLVLDDAATSDQVAPLLPATPGCLVIITSRNRLPELDDVYPLTLDILSPDEGAQMLLRLAHRTPETTNAHEVARIVELCGRLPIAIAIIASQLRIHPAWSTRYLADQLAHAYDRLDELHAGERSVRAVFDTSVHDLPTDQHELFTLLGVHHGPEIDEYAAAALADTTPARARHLLDALYTRHLIQETSPRRYRLHDLLRVYAHTHATHLDPEHQYQATTRVLDYYLHTTYTAASHLPIYRTPSTTATLTPPRHPQPITDTSHAMAWLTTELLTFLTAIDHTHLTHPRHTLHLSTTLHPFLRTAGHWHHAHTIHHTALTVAIRTHDPQAHATTLNDLGTMYRLRSELPAAQEALSQALHLYTKIGDRRGQANALKELGTVYRLRVELPAAQEALSQSLQLFTDIGDRLGQANALNDLGTVYRLRSELPAAQEALSQALHLYTEIGDRRGQANVLNDLGIVDWTRGELPAAQKASSQSLQLFTDIGDRLGQGNALKDLGLVYRLRGELPAAQKALSQSLQLFTDIGSRIGQGNALNDLGTVYRLRGELPAAQKASSQSLQLFTDIGDRLGQANALNGLGLVYRLRGELPAAQKALSQSLQLFTDIGDRHGQANALNALGTVYRLRGELPAAQKASSQSLQLCTDIGDLHGQANAHLETGIVHHRTREHHLAITHLTQALYLFTQVENVDGQAETHNALGDLSLDHPAAGDPHIHFTTALTLARECDSRLHVANALVGQARCHYRTGNNSQAVPLLQRALVIYLEIHAPEATQITNLLHALDADSDRIDTPPSHS
ncbi:hypothetical protein ALI144C_52750 [Actinosynnema sp. ALI-1.44]|nr:hypothetical protein ALI144C_52750 [Actinosynnema sp. ALI-1.44]